MPDVREKLVELLRSVPRAEEVSIGRGSGKSFVRLAIIADHLIANGVTIQRWIPVTERLPEDNIQVLACTKHGKPFTAHCAYGGEWRVSGSVTITHWMPLPEPPKEE